MSYSLLTKTALSILGQLIKTGRQQRPWSQKELATRLGVTRQTVMAIEKGDPAVAIGSVFEAAMLVGLPLLGAETPQQLTQWQAALMGFQSLVPQRTHTQTLELSDDF